MSSRRRTVKAFLDTNIFIYAAGKEHALRKPSLKVLNLVSTGEIVAITNAEVIQELFHLFIRRGRRADALTLGKTVIELSSEVLPVGRTTMIKAAALLETYPNLPARDAVHAATMIENEIDLIITADKDFEVISGIRILKPQDV